MMALVPARSNSKGLPGKNIKTLNGKPMIAYTIEEALKSKYITDVVISTDSKEIENIAIEYGAKSHFMRPGYLAEDSSKAIDNYIYTIDRLKKEFNYVVDDFIVLQPTSPLRTVEDIEGAISLFKKKNADSVISYAKAHHPIEWHKYVDKDGKIEHIFEPKLKNRQELKESYLPNGAISIFNYELIKSKKYFSDKTYSYIMPIDRSIDIDTENDFLFAEFIIKKNQNLNG